MLRYKTAEGKKENKFGFGGKPQGAAFARQIVDPWQILATSKHASTSMAVVQYY